MDREAVEAWLDRLCRIHGPDELRRLLAAAEELAPALGLAKEAARANVVAAAQSKVYGKREIAIRCNGLDTPWGRDDLIAAGQSAAAAVVIVASVIRVEGAQNLTRAAAIFSALCCCGSADAAWCVILVSCLEGRKPKSELEQVFSLSRRSEFRS